jgi:uncharacterized membrane protein
MGNNTMMPYVLAAAFGAISGLRTFAAPAFLSHWLSRDGRKHTEDTAERLLSSETASRATKLFAAGELMMDKLPGVRDRTAPNHLLARMVSGALVGAVAASYQGGRRDLGAVVGALAAVISAHGGLYLRKTLSQRLSLPDTLVGLMEDGVMVGAGVGLLQSMHPGASRARRQITPVSAELKSAA